VYLSSSSGTIVESNCGNALTFSPSPFTINSLEPSDLADCFASGKGLLVLNRANNLEFHDLLGQAA
jgi:hypothetical protein